MAKVTVQHGGIGGAVFALAAADADLKVEFANTGREVVFVSNAGSGAIDVTMETTKAGATGEVQTKVVSVANDSKPVMFGPFVPFWFNDEDGICTVAVSDDTDVTVAVVGV